MKKNVWFYSLVLACFSQILLQAQTIDFEVTSPHGSPKVEGDNVHPTYYLSNYNLSFYHWYNSTTDWQMEYVEVGGDEMFGFATGNTDPYQTSTGGSCNGTTSQHDHPAASPYDMGCWMITDEGPDFPSPPSAVEVRFQSLSVDPCYEISGLLIDIDGNEAWRMDVYDQANYSPGDLSGLGTPMYRTYLVSDTWGSGGSCTGCATIDTDSIYNEDNGGNYLAGDGVPTYWHAKVNSPIQSVIFTYVGHQHNNARFAFDNIKLREDAIEECSTESSFFSSVVGNEGTFIPTPQVSAGSKVVGYDWEVNGDKFTDNVLNYTFRRKGTVEVCLTVTAINEESGACCTDTYCEYVNIAEDPGECYLEPSFNYQCYTQDCIYKFSGKPGGGNRNITNWYWEFSDGSRYYTQDVLKTFNSPGVYEICLTVVGEVDEEGECCTETYCRTIDFSDCNPIPFIEDCDNDDGPGFQPAFKTGNSDPSNADENQLEGERAMDMKLYPNPTQSAVSLELEISESITVSIDLISVNGQRTTLKKNLKIDSGKVENLDLLGFSSGVYVLEVLKDGNRIAAEKLVIE